ncbi:amidase family protein, partial [Alicyclobacillus mali (ex Roth et al. 2021)]
MDAMTGTLVEWAMAIRQGDVSSFDAVARHLEQMAAHNVDGMGIRAVIEVNPEALLEAEARDRERRTGFLRGPLHGVPILVKDNLDTA